MTVTWCSGVHKHLIEVAHNLPLAEIKKFRYDAKQTASHAKQFSESRLPWVSICWLKLEERTQQAQKTKSNEEQRARQGWDNIFTHLLFGMATDEWSPCFVCLLTKQPSHFCCSLSSARSRGSLPSFCEQTGSTELAGRVCFRVKTDLDLDVSPRAAPQQ